MLPLPPALLHLGWRNHVCLGRDYYVRVDTSDYSVDPTAIGARVDVAATWTTSASATAGASSPSTPGVGRAP